MPAVPEPMDVSKSPNRLATVEKRTKTGVFSPTRCRKSAFVYLLSALICR